MHSGGNIFLSGFMGSGKTTVGKKLAKLTCQKFIDLDQYIEEKERQSIQSLFADFGEEAFRKTEQTRLTEVITANNNAVIALGGGTLCYQSNLQKVKESGLLLYIELSATTLAQRLEGAKVQRPLLENLKGGELITFIENKLHERSPYYSASHITVNGLNLTPQLLQEKISEYKKNNN